MTLEQVTRTNERVARAEERLLRYNVAEQMGLLDRLDELTGATIEEIEQSAEQLLAGGSGVVDDGSPLDPRALAARVPRW